jgi:selenocysteine lyase/cysteine desulfurase
LISINKIRCEFPVTQDYIYLDHAASAPLPKRVLDASNRVNEEKYYGDIFWDKWEALVEDTRKTIARFINAHSDEIALIPNTSEGISIVANGIPWKKGDNIVTSNLEFPSNLIPWQVQAMKHKVQIRIVKAGQNGELKIEDFAEKIDEKTKVVAISHVQYSNGFKTNLRELSKLVHSKSAYLVTDAVQSLGQMPVDVKNLGVDFLATSGYKWLLSPMATGFLFVKKDLIEKIGLSIVGYRSAEKMQDFSFRKFNPAKTARRFEHGQLNFSGFAGMNESFRMLEGVNIRKIERRIFNLTDQIIDNIKEMKNLEIDSCLLPDHRSGIIKLKCKNPEKVNGMLRRKGVVISVRDKGLRISPHFYNTPEEIEKFLTLLHKEVL